MNTKQSVKQCVETDLNQRIEAGATLESIKLLSENTIEQYCLEFRMQYAHKLAPFKDATVNRNVERWLSKKS